MLPALMPGFTTVRAVFVSGAATPAGAALLNAAIDAAEPIDAAGATADDVYGVFYTGGTTAASKGVMLTHGNIVANAMNILTEVGFSTATVYLHAAPSVEIRIADEQDREVPPGTVGQILVRGPVVMKGYWNQPALSAEALRGGWMHTGDGGYMDTDGFVFVVDRIKDMIITGGENVYSAEVENAIYQHPAVAMCAVIGVPDERWGERVHAVITLRPGQITTEAEVVAHCGQLIAGYKCPRTVSLRAEPLPLSGAGKVLKTVLRKELET